MAQQQQTSYFDERKNRYNDPNFFNRTDIIQDITKNAKRIIRDIRFGNISDEDYIYFTQSNVLNTLHQVAEKNYNDNIVQLNALNLYINWGIRNAMVPAWTTPTMETALAANAQINLNNKIMIWKTLCMAFQDIKQGMDPRELYRCLSVFEPTFILSL